MTTPAQAASRKRLVHHLDTPFSTTSWPEISPEDQDVILALLCSFLGPLGQHRRAHIRPSKGKRAARRARKSAQPAPSSVPAKPELDDGIDIGFNSISRKLELNSQESSGNTYSMVFVARGNQSPAFNCHLPQMVGVASRHLPAGEKTRLVGFSKSCAESLSGALGLPRVSSVAVKGDVPGADTLLSFVRDKVAPITVPWMDSGDPEYRATRINTVETCVGTRKEKRARLEGDEGIDTTQ